MRTPYDEAEFIDNPLAPQYFIDDLQDVIIRGSVCEIIPFTYRRTDGGVWIKENSHTCITPLSSISSMVALVTRKVGAHAVAYAAEAAIRPFRRLHS